MLIFGLVFICFYYCRTICNDNLEYEFNENGLYLTILNYSILLSMILINIINNIIKNKQKIQDFIRNHENLMKMDNEKVEFKSGNLKKQKKIQ